MAPRLSDQPPDEMGDYPTTEGQVVRAWLVLLVALVGIVLWFYFMVTEGISCGTC